MATGRFAQVNEEEINKCIINRIPENTARKVKWAMKIFNEWFMEWKCRLDEELKVFKDLYEFDKSDLNYCLRYFICEIRKENHEKYPPQTLKEIVAMIQHHFNNAFHKSWSIFKDPEFIDSRNVLDAQMKSSARDGCLKPKRRASPITFEDEESLWSNGSFGVSSPKQLLNTLIYHFGIHLSLRACQEHRDLVYGNNSQLSLEVLNGQECLRYTERTSKNNKFGLKCSRMEPKSTVIYPNKENPERCVVRMYQTYIGHRPEMEGDSAFYLTPINKPQGNIWYKKSPLGIHSIEKVTKELMKFKMKNYESATTSFYSNTSLRRTTKQRLIDAGVSKEIAQTKTGRISEKADKSYFNTEKFNENMTEILCGTSKSSSITNSNLSCVNSSSAAQVSLNFHNCSFTNCSFK